MVQTFNLTGLVSAPATAISIGAYLGRDRVGVLTALRLLTRHTYAIAAHGHTFTGNALAVHGHTFAGASLAHHTHVWSGHGIAVASFAFDSRLALMMNAGALRGSSATAMGAFPPGTAVNVSCAAQVPAGANATSSAGTPTGANTASGAGTILGISQVAYTIDSNGRYVDETTHPAALHAVLKPHGAAGPRIELGNAVIAGDIIEITTLMQRESGGIF